MKSSPLRHPARLAGASLLRLQSDARLAELAVAGHEAAFDAIVDRYRTPLARYCAGIVGPSRAEDAVQQALINAHDALKRTDEVRHLRSWLYRIAHNASLNVLRAVRDDVPLEEGALGGAAAAAALGPAEAFERSERFRATVAALQELPERQRAALLLRELEGRSHEEIAAALGVTKGSARQHLMRARIAVRGAVTAVTPYPLVARLAEMLTAGGGAAPAWTDAAVGAGAGATLAKFTAGVAATGALVGGAVGGSHVVHHGGGDGGGTGTVSREVAAQPKRVVKAVSSTGTAAVSVTPASLTSSGATTRSSSATERRSDGKQDHSPSHHHRGSVTPAAAASPQSSSGSGSGNDDANERHRDSSDDNNGRDDTTRHGSRSSGKNRDDNHSGSSNRRHKRSRSREDDDSTSSSSSSGKGHSKSTTDKPTPTTTTPTTTAPSDDTSASSGSSTSGSTDSNSVSNSGESTSTDSSSSGSSNPTSTDDITSSGTGGD
ncbi:MAG TPA: sigma-70 family RNA polymerase sigma factor [Baekduia sp.]|nr:sigma-70 family RNA polymerase sigma factor [Baekduia sp.]